MAPPPGRPGRCDRKIPSGASRSTSAAGVAAGTTVTSHPRLDELPQDVPLDAAIVGHDPVTSSAGRRVSSGAPASTRRTGAIGPSRLAARGSRLGRRRIREATPRRSASRRRAASQQTSFTRSRPIRPGEALALATRLLGRRSVVEMTPSCAPWSRMCRVRARVSIPWIPTMPRSRRYSSSDCVARQLLARTLPSLTTNPSTKGRRDSTSSGFTPVVPDEGIGHGHDLPLVGRIGQDLLIAAHQVLKTTSPTASPSAP